MKRSAPFNPNDAFDLMADTFRREVAILALRAESTEPYRSMTTAEQAQAFMAGAITGVVGVLFAMIDEAGRDELMATLADYLPHARLNAEDILRESRRHEH